MNLDDFKKAVLDDEISNSKIIVMFCEILENDEEQAKEALSLMRDYRPVAARTTCEMFTNLREWQSGR